MNSFNFHHLRYFQVVADAGSLTAAARRLSVSQSSISVQIKQLESFLGVPLFDREHKSLRLTEEGRLVLDFSRTIFDTGDELVATLRHRSEAFRKKVRIGAVATLSRNFQLNVLQELIADETVEVIIRSAGLGELLSQLSEFQLDLVLANQPVLDDAGSALQCRLIDQQPVSIIGHPSRKTRKRFRFPQSLEGIPMILPAKGNGIRQAFDLLMEQSGITPLVAAEADDMAMLRLLAREMDALTVIPPVVVRDEIKSRQLTEVYRIAGLNEDFFAITCKRRYANPYLKKILG